MHSGLKPSDRVNIMLCYLSIKGAPGADSWKETVVGFGRGSLYGIPVSHHSSPGLILNLPHHWGMSILAVDPETQADLHWSASQSGSRPGDFGSDRDFEPLIPSLWFLIRWRLSFSPLSHSQCQLQVYFLHHQQHLFYAGVAMPTPRHGNLDSSRISTSTRLPVACITRPPTDLTSSCRAFYI